MTTYLGRETDRGTVEIIEMTRRHGVRRENEFNTLTAAAEAILCAHFRAVRDDLILTHESGPYLAARKLAQRFRNRIAGSQWRLTTPDITRWLEGQCDPLVAEARRAVASRGGS